MPSISELRTILIPATHTSRAFPDNIYMWSALYVTWMLIKLKLTANQVTYFSGIFCVIGGVLLAMNSVWFILLGIACIIMFHILDCCDGYVARYNRESSIFGRFLDWYMHFVRDAAIFIGLAIGAYLSYANIILLVLGFFAVLSPIMHKTILNCGWTAICWERLVIMKKGQDVAEKLFRPDSINIKEDDLPEKNFSKKSFKSMFFLFVTSPFSFYAPVALTGLIILQLAINFVFNITFDFRPVIIIYTAVIGTVYTLLMLRKKSKSQCFEKGYRRLFFDSEDGKHIQLPRDYFF